MPAYVHTQKLRTRSMSPRLVCARADRMLAALGRAEAELSILICNDEVIHRLNRDYRGVDRPTDVLAFPMAEGEGAEISPDLLGDVVISLPTAAKQARAAGKTISSEVTMLLAHGLLHLLGYDHRDAAEEREMLEKTRALCLAAGLRGELSGTP
jgi:probable rRNA maturation factor